MNQPITLQPFPLPTGRWLQQERERLQLLRSQVAAAVGCYHQTLTRIEQRNLVVPPGWVSRLRDAGLRIHEPMWSADLPPYAGTTWARELSTQTGRRRSAAWWGAHLGVSEALVRAAWNSDRPVPPRYLLKLAELGMNVPEPVKATLPQRRVVEQGPHPRAEAPAPRPTPPEEPPPPRLAETPEASAARHEPASILLHWTEDSGLRLHVSAGLLDQVPVGVRELLSRLSTRASQ